MSKEAKRDRSNELARGTFYWADPDELIIVGLDTPHKSREEHPLYDPRIHLPITEAEVNNVLYYGVKKTVIARREDALGLVMVDGRQRVRRARAAKKLQIERGEPTIRVPVMIEKGDDKHVFGLSRALNSGIKVDGPMTTARNVQFALSMGKTITEVANDLQVSEQTIRNYQAFFDLHKDVAEAMESQEISSTVALQLVGLSHDEQKAVVKEIKDEQKATGKKVTVAKAAKKVAERQGKQTNTPKERIERAKNLLLKYALKTAAEQTKEEMQSTLERISRVLLGMGLEKLAATDEE